MQNQGQRSHMVEKMEPIAIVALPSLDIRYMLGYCACVPAWYRDIVGGTSDQTLYEGTCYCFPPTQCAYTRRCTHIPRQTLAVTCWHLHSRWSTLLECRLHCMMLRLWRHHLLFCCRGGAFSTVAFRWRWRRNQQVKKTRFLIHNKRSK